MNKKEIIRALCYRLRARHVRALDYEYILLMVESGDDEIPREDWVKLIAIFGLRPPASDPRLGAVRRLGAAGHEPRRQRENYETLERLLSHQTQPSEHTSNIGRFIKTCTIASVKPACQNRGATCVVPENLYVRGQLLCSRKVAASSIMAAPNRPTLDEQRNLV